MKLLIRAACGLAAGAAAAVRAGPARGRSGGGGGAGAFFLQPAAASNNIAANTAAFSVLLFIRILSILASTNGMRSKQANTVLKLL